MIYLTSLATVVVAPLLVGYAYGANHIDPNTPEGVIYYA